MCGQISSGISAHLCHGTQVLGPQRGLGQTGFSLLELTFQSGRGHYYVHNVTLSREMCYEENSETEAIVWAEVARAGL